MVKAYDLHIRGIVQGVGFRPFVYRQAQHWGLVGWVLNAGDGVHTHLEGDERALEGFLGELRKRAPAAAHITSLEVAKSHIEGLSFFSIRESDAATETNTLISPDIATCPECLQEFFDPDDRRFHYPFINCTNCGPRFTIIGALPYDRPNTSMADFAMCESCNHEYHDPLDRRFHAQPDACFACGPTLRLYRSGKTTTEARGRAESDALIEEAASLIACGRIVAIKGLGGYHLACDATNEDAVATLRRRKRRTAKPFALMVRDLSSARALCQVDDHEAALLSGTARPIVLLKRHGRQGWREQRASTDDPLAPSVAGSLHELGIMLPSTPVQHLLMALVATPLVMTSGNISEEPIIAREVEAHELLARVADAFLDNDREILSRYDDSVVRVIEGRAQFVRRARGYAPQPLPFFREKPAGREKEAQEEVSYPDILAVGPEQKNTFCLIRAKEAFCSQHLGDLENASSFDAWLTTLGLYGRLFDLDWQALACDTHPEYLSTKWARAQDKTRIEVQHHHAHIASVLMEHRAAYELTKTEESSPGNRVIGIAFDGTGYGDDGALWGGEVLIASFADYERFAHVRYVPLPGGKAAIDHPDRMAWSYLRTFGLTEHPGAASLVAGIGSDQPLLDQIIARRLNTPDTSSMGRLFDAASALAGVCATSSYEGQAAVELEAALYDPATGNPVADPDGHDAARRYRFELTETPAQREREGASPQKQTQPTCVIDPAPTLSALLDDLLASMPPSYLALRFHEAVVQLIVDLCNRARLCHRLSTVALGGGVFMNRYLVTRVVPLLECEGFTVLLNRELPANDGGISYGQAAIAAARLTHPTDESRTLGK
jgi:hydrogenase maturation protein HypF